MTATGLAFQVLVYAAAAAAEIGGCFAIWAVLRNGAPKPWLLVGVCLLVIFAWLLTLIPSASAGRAFAAYGGIYIVASIGAMWFLERTMPDVWDISGGLVCLAGAALILFAPRTA
ncbi:MAG: YnfA family protein [Aquidulcibacter sp.]|jgi:small multidrug resistance family-3 protein|uniref:YnfA family protein n=1 Tax=Aquidulcibacter sp. TaxID=2052990 RepID=UPI0022C3944E|nr:YnfA family protein [Aquidulcibacter sp.]|eukprot:gene16046-21784_t